MLAGSGRAGGELHIGDGLLFGPVGMLLHALLHIIVEQPFLSVVGAVAAGDPQLVFIIILSVVAVDPLGIEYSAFLRFYEKSLQCFLGNLAELKRF